jgi:hypothetical protein
MRCGRLKPADFYYGEGASTIKLRAQVPEFIGRFIFGGTLRYHTHTPTITSTIDAFKDNRTDLNIEEGGP